MIALATTIITANATILVFSSIIALNKVTMILVEDSFDVPYFSTKMAKTRKSAWLGIATIERFS